MSKKSREIRILILMISSGVFASFLLLFAMRRLSTSNVLIEEVLLASLLSGFTPLILAKTSKIVSNAEYSSFDRFLGKDKLRSMLLSSTIILLSLTLTVHTIVNIDRSRSFYIFEWINCAPEKVSEEQLSDILLEKFGKESELAFQTRLEEHLRRGLVSKSQGVLALTVSGKFIFKTSRILGNMFLLEDAKKMYLWNDEKCR